MLAQAIAKAESRNSKTRDFAFMARMLHDIGKLVLAVRLPERYREVSALVEHGEGDDVLRDQFVVDTAQSGAEALTLLDSRGPYAVILSDMNMPGMTGVELLREAKKVAPDTVRVMLTGNSDQGTAIDAINEGDIFRFLSKPCSPRDLARTTLTALNQNRLLTAEQDLLEKTLKGSIEALTGALALVNPEAFGRTTRLQRYIREIVSELGCDDLWKLETTALLSQLGLVVLPDEVLTKLYRGEALSDEEEQLYNQCPFLAADLVAKIPRMEEIGQAIQYQAKNFDGSGIPVDGVKGGVIVKSGVQALNQAAT